MSVVMKETWHRPMQRCGSLVKHEGPSHRRIYSQIQINVSFVLYTDIGCEISPWFPLRDDSVQLFSDCLWEFSWFSVWAADVKTVRMGLFVIESRVWSFTQNQPCPHPLFLLNSCKVAFQLNPHDAFKENTHWIRHCEIHGNYLSESSIFQLAQIPKGR